CLLDLARSPPPSTPFPYPTLFRSSRPVAEEAALEAPFRQRSQSGSFRKGAEEGRGIPLRIRHRHLCRLDAAGVPEARRVRMACRDRKSTRLNSSHVKTSYAVFCLN